MLLLLTYLLSWFISYLVKYMLDRQFVTMLGSLPLPALDAGGSLSLLALEFLEQLRVVIKQL